MLVETASGDAARRDHRTGAWAWQSMSIAAIYWTQKGSGGNGRILRASVEVPKGETAAHRSDIEALFEGLPEPIDLDVDLPHRLMYWTDRGDPPRGNTVSRAPMDPPRAFRRPTCRSADPVRRSEGRDRRIARSVRRQVVRDRPRWHGLQRGPRRLGRQENSHRARRADRHRVRPGAEVGLVPGADANSDRRPTGSAC